VTVLVKHLAVGDYFQFRRQRRPDIYEVVHLGTRPVLGFRLAGTFHLGVPRMLPVHERGDSRAYEGERDVKKIHVDVVVARETA
jgi:hypothetical protein